MKEAINLFELLVEYSRLVVESAAVVNIHPEDVRPVFGYALDDLKFHRMYKNHRVTQKIRCISAAIDAGVGNTIFARQLWKEERPNVESLFDRIEKCSARPNNEDEARYVSISTSQNRFTLHKRC